MLRHLLLLASIVCALPPSAALAQVRTQPAPQPAGVGRDVGSYRGKTAEQWRQLLRSSEYKVLRRRAAYALGRIPADAAPSVAVLESALTDRDLVTRWYAADSLGRLGAASGSATAEMITGLSRTSNDKDVRRNLAKALGRIGPAAKRALPALEEALKTDDLTYRIEVAVALWRIDQRKPALDALNQLLDGDDDLIAFQALRAMESVGQEHTETSRLLKQLTRNSSDTRRAAARLLGLRGAESLPELLAVLDKPDHEITSVIAALGYQADRLRGLLFDPKLSAAERQQHVVAARNMAQALGKKLSLAQAAVRRRAVGVLAKLDILAAAAIVDRFPALNEEQRVDANDCVERIVDSLREEHSRLPWWKAAGTDLLTPLIGLLDSDDAASKRLGLWLFAELSVDSADMRAVPELRTALRDNDVFNRRNAARALRHLQSDAPVPQ